MGNVYEFISTTCLYISEPWILGTALLLIHKCRDSRYMYLLVRANYKTIKFVVYFDDSLIFAKCIIIFCDL